VFVDSSVGVLAITSLGALIVVLYRRSLSTLVDSSPGALVTASLLNR
jgi:hypothetical protein